MGTFVDIVPMRDLLAADWAALDALCSGFSDEQWESPTCLPGWKVKDVLAHVAGLEMMIEGEPSPDVEVSHLPHVENDFDAMVEVWVEAQRPLGGPAVLDGFRRITATRCEHLESMTQADFDAPSWTPVGRDETYGRFMRIRHFDTFLHELDICHAVGEMDRADPDAVTVALTEADNALGVIAARKARLPDGSLVRIDLTGAAERTYLISVDGDHAHLSDHSERVPDTTLTMSDTLFLRFIGGRTPPGGHLGADLTIAGDHEMGMLFASHMAVTI